MEINVKLRKPCVYIKNMLMLLLIKPFMDEKKKPIQEIFAQLALNTCKYQGKMKLCVFYDKVYFQLKIQSDLLRGLFLRSVQPYSLAATYKCLLKIFFVDNQRENWNFSEILKPPCPKIV